MVRKIACHENMRAKIELSSIMYKAMHGCVCICNLRAVRLDAGGSLGLAATSLPQDSLLWH